MHLIRRRCDVRKLLNDNILLSAALSLFIAACGGGPTAPTSTDTSKTAVVSPPSEPAPVPGPAPAPGPTPAPAPPAPVPGEPVTRYTAHVDTAHWYGAPLFPSPTFEVSRYADRVVLGTLTVPIVYQDDRNVIARTSEMSFSVVDSDWTFNSTSGTAAGTLSR